MCIRDSANANLVSAANVGAQLALRSNNVNGIPTDAGGDRNGTLTFRRSATGNSVAQLAFSATDNYTYVVTQTYLTYMVTGRRYGIQKMMVLLMLTNLVVVHCQVLTLTS